MQGVPSLLVSVFFVAACSAESTAPAAPAPSDEAPALEADPLPATFGEEKRPAGASCAADASAEHLEDHACFHVKEGPFETVLSGRPSSPGRLSRTHVAYTVEVAGRATRWVSFRAKSASTYAFLLGANAQIDTFSPDGSVISPACEGETTGICDGLSRKVVVPLAKDATVLLGVTPGSGSKVLVLVEDAG